jgi:hypothetical protein
MLRNQGKNAAEVSKSWSELDHQMREAYPHSDEDRAATVTSHATEADGARKLRK